MTNTDVRKCLQCSTLYEMDPTTVWNQSQPLMSFQRSGFNLVNKCWFALLFSVNLKCSKTRICKSSSKSSDESCSSSKQNTKIPLDYFWQSMGPDWGYISHFSCSSGVIYHTTKASLLLFFYLFFYWQMPLFVLLPLTNASHSFVFFINLFCNW